MTFAEQEREDTANAVALVVKAAASTRCGHMSCARAWIGAQVEVLRSLPIEQARRHTRALMMAIRMIAMAPDQPGEACPKSADKDRRMFEEDQRLNLN